MPADPFPVAKLTCARKHVDIILQRSRGLDRDRHLRPSLSRRWSLLPRTS